MPWRRSEGQSSAVKDCLVILFWIQTQTPSDNFLQLEPQFHRPDVTIKSKFCYQFELQTAWWVHSKALLERPVRDRLASTGAHCTTILICTVLFLTQSIDRAACLPEGGRKRVVTYFFRKLMCEGQPFFIKT